ncbi:type VI secretion system contractile sheath domain-containing protein [Aporhodopirellula aestuarii]|uniref:Type VI secretion system contractile sheath large subunit n=1 Tax=Aporhodopirellula aestuarii TaxID=2950107 RepID=A0ABT0TZC7_9BACT|nr:type VI secretion system contractile sheath large subunit [Aporhodopirellula aestuarii]MCM2369906.1 type VI secretion system contractile sheath large subunit [Aporhodopirellula aestuarii]
MEYSVNFGRISNAAARPAGGGPFRIAVLGDLSGRANTGRLEIGDELASKTPLRVDVDNLDEIIERLDIQLRLPIGDDGGTAKIPLTEMDDFHPDQLYDQLDVFSKLAGLRKKLADNSTFEGAARAVQSLCGTDAVERNSHLARRARGTQMPNMKMSDFASLVGRPTANDAETPINNLIKQLIRPHLSVEADPRQEQMLATVDDALSDTMRRVLHDPDFQALESVWRCIELLVRRIETDVNLQIVLYDISAEEIAADLSSAENLEDTGLYKLLVEQPSLDAQQGALSVLIGNYTFEQTPPHADLLGRMAKICASANAPFIASISKECLKKLNPEDVHPVVKQSWDQLYALPEAAYLALTVPRFMLRWPYGKKSEPIDSFEFEEFTPRSGVSGMLWGNSSFLSGLLIGLTYQSQGLKDMKLGSILGVDDIPFYYYTDQHGDQIALPCTDRLLSDRLAAHVNSQNFIPVLSIKGRNEVRVGGFRSLAGAELAGPWAPIEIAAGSQIPALPTTQPTPASQPAEPVSDDDSVDDDLDALLADLDTTTDDAPAAEPTSDTADPAATEPSTESDADDDLDALLAELGGGDEPAPESDDAMDPELEALLGDL